MFVHNAAILFIFLIFNLKRWLGTCGSVNAVPMQYLLMRNGLTRKSNRMRFIPLAALPSCFSSMTTALPKSLSTELATVRIEPEELEKLQNLLVEIEGHIKNNDIEKIVATDIEFHGLLYQVSRNERLVTKVIRLKTVSRHGCSCSGR